MTHSLTIMTYNVHRCSGIDRKTSPGRIAEVIARYNAGIVALQEVSSGTARPAHSDQAREITANLEAIFPSHPYSQVEKERCGNIILSRYPMRLVKAGGLLPPGKRQRIAKRGALWVEIEAFGQKIQVFNTHLGITPKARLTQSEALVGPEWLRNPVCLPPIILCGDFNAQPGSTVHRNIEEVLQDVLTKWSTGHSGKTWPSLHPVTSIDHLFISANILVENSLVPQTELTRVSSDHLPLVVTINIP
jgi:endonuclease/exonuclease/phosphatase family metal-dependent hydrolase